MGDVVTWNLPFIVDECLAPDLGVDLVVGVQMLADVILQLGNRIELLLSVNIHSGGSLTKQGCTLVFAKFSSHFYI